MGQVRGQTLVHLQINSPVSICLLLALSSTAPSTESGAGIFLASPDLLPAAVALPSPSLLEVLVAGRCIPVAVTLPVPLLLEVLGLENRLHRWGLLSGTVLFPCPVPLLLVV